MTSISTTRRLAQFLWHGQVEVGIVEGDHIVGLDDDSSGEGPQSVIASLSSVRLLPPSTPQNVVAIGRNYRDHAVEMNAEVPTEPLIFLKSVTSVIASGEAIIYPSWVSQQVDFEGELAVIIGRTCYRVREEDALYYVQGYTCANDVTARDLQRRDEQWARAKGFDTFCPLGPVIAEGIDPSDLALTTRVNGKVRQQGRTSDLIFSIPQLISHISAVMTLRPGDVILTGSPAGVGPLMPGDVVEVQIEGIGTLRNPVVAGE